MTAMTSPHLLFSIYVAALMALPAGAETDSTQAPLTEFEKDTFRASIHNILKDVMKADSQTTLTESIRQGVLSDRINMFKDVDKNAKLTPAAKAAAKKNISDKLDGRANRTIEILRSEIDLDKELEEDMFLSFQNNFSPAELRDLSVYFKAMRTPAAKKFLRMNDQVTSDSITLFKQHLTPILQSTAEQVEKEIPLP